MHKKANTSITLPEIIIMGFLEKSTLFRMVSERIRTFFIDIKGMKQSRKNKMKKRR